MQRFTCDIFVITLKTLTSTAQVILVIVYLIRELVKPNFKLNCHHSPVNRQETGNSNGVTGPLSWLYAALFTISCEAIACLRYHCYDRVSTPIYEYEYYSMENINEEFLNTTKPVPSSYCCCDSTLN